jgi:hypothetical protein
MGSLRSGFGQGHMSLNLLAQQPSTRGRIATDDIFAHFPTKICDKQEFSTRALGELQRTFKPTIPVQNRPSRSSGATHPGSLLTVHHSLTTVYQPSLPSFPRQRLQQSVKIGQIPIFDNHFAPPLVILDPHLQSQRALQPLRHFFHIGIQRRL